MLGWCLVLSQVLSVEYIPDAGHLENRVGVSVCRGEGRAQLHQPAAPVAKPGCRRRAACSACARVTLGVPVTRSNCTRQGVSHACGTPAAAAAAVYCDGLSASPCRMTSAAQQQGPAFVPPPIPPQLHGNATRLPLSLSRCQQAGRSLAPQWQARCQLAHCSCDWGTCAALLLQGG